MVCRSAGALIDFCQEIHSQRRQVADLKTAPATNRKTGAAVGVLMARHNLTYDDAWRILTKASQDNNHKIADVADDVLSTGALAEQSRGARVGRCRRLRVEPAAPKRPTHTVERRALEPVGTRLYRDLAGKAATSSPQRDCSSPPVPPSPSVSTPSTTASAADIRRRRTAAAPIALTVEV